MKSKKRMIAIVLLLAVLVSTVSCGKGTNQPAPNYEGLWFDNMEDGAWVRGHNDGNKDVFTGEELVIPTVSPEGIYVSQIATFGFHQCPNLKKVTVPYSIMKIGAAAFEDCTALETVEISGGIDGLYTETFAGCTSLTTVSLPYSLSFIASDIFLGCTSLTEVTYHGTMELWSEIFKSEKWLAEGQTLTIHCLDGDIVEQR